MSVPFDSLGPGQVGRLVYQVIGQNGPISNPSNIRYLSPDQMGTASIAQSGVPGLDMALAAGQIATLGLGLANLGMSVAIMNKLGKMDERLKTIESGVARLEQKTDLILEKVSRIDIATAEQNLRSSLHHVLSQAIGPDEIDLNQMSRLESDLERFVESLSPAELHYGLHPGLRFSSDVRDMLSAMYHLMRGARLHMWAAYNRLIQGSPVASVSDDHLRLAIQPSSSGVITNLLVRGFLAQTESALLESVESNSFFGNSSATDIIRQFFAPGGVPTRFDNAMYMSGEAENLVADTLESRVVLPDMEDSAERTAEVLGEARSLVDNYLSYWWMSDAALLFKLGVELNLRSLDEAWAPLERASLAFGPSNNSKTLPPIEFNPERAEREISFA